MPNESAVCFDVFLSALFNSTCQTIPSNFVGPVTVELTEVGCTCRGCFLILIIILLFIPFHAPSPSPPRMKPHRRAEDWLTRFSMLNISHNHSVPWIYSLTVLTKNCRHCTLSFSYPWLAFTANLYKFIHSFIHVLIFTTEEKVMWHRRNEQTRLAGTSVQILRVGGQCICLCFLTFTKSAVTNTPLSNSGKKLHSVSANYAGSFPWCHGRD